VISTSTGTVAPLTEASSCVECPVGQAQPAPGQTDCSDCQAGAFNDKLGQASCQDCPGVLYSLKAASSCELCNKGYFVSLKKTCIQCDEGVICDVDGGSIQQQLTLKKGVWRLTETTDTIHVCPLPNSCRGGSSSQVHQRKLGILFDSDIYCEDGYTGPMCAVCDPDGYFFDPDKQQCMTCNQRGLGSRLISSPSLILPLLILTTLLICVAGMLLCSRKKRSGQGGLFHSLISPVKLASDSMRVNRNGSISFIKNGQRELSNSWKQRTSVTYTSAAKITKSTVTLTSGTERIRTETAYEPTSSFLSSKVPIISNEKNKFKALLAFR